MDRALDQARSDDPKDRLAALDRLHSLLDASIKPLPAPDVAALVTACLEALGAESDSRAALRALQCLALAAVISGDVMKLHFEAILPVVVERLGDQLKSLRDAARGLLLTLMEVASPAIVLEKSGTFAWQHTSWRVREEFARIAASAISVFASRDLMALILPSILQMLDDSTQSVREAALLCIKEMYVEFGTQFQDELRPLQVPPTVEREIKSIFEKTTPKACSLDQTVICSSRGEISSNGVSQKATHINTTNSGHETLGSSIQVAHSSEMKSVRNGSERGTGKMSAIQALLNSLELSQKQSFQDKRSTSLDLGNPSLDRGVQRMPVLSTGNAIFTDSTASTIRKALPSSYTGKRASERLECDFIEERIDEKFAKRAGNTHAIKSNTDAPFKDAKFTDPAASNIPNFQKPLSRKSTSFRASMKGYLEDNKILLGEMPDCTDGPASIHDALTEGLSPSSNWSSRVAAFNYVKDLLQQGPKGIQEIVQNFEKVMKLFFQHLEDPHHKVAHAALSALSEIVPACRRPFESYLDKILYHVFSRLIDPKDSVRQLSLTNLEVVSKNYSIDSLLPALLRALDEQRSPKAKVAVIEYAISSLKKNQLNPEGASNGGILKLWLAKLLPLVYDKNIKLKEAAISCIISVHCHYDTTAVLNFILSMSVEDQNSLRRAIRQRSNRIEMDLMNFLQSKKQRSKVIYVSADSGIFSEDGYIVPPKRTFNYGGNMSDSVEADSGKKLHPVEEQDQRQNPRLLPPVAQDHLSRSFEASNGNVLKSNIKNLNQESTASDEDVNSDILPDHVSEDHDHGNIKNSSLPFPHSSGSMDKGSIRVSVRGSQIDTAAPSNIFDADKKLFASRLHSSQDSQASLPHILHQMSSHETSSSVRKQAVQQLTEASIRNDSTIWSKYFNQTLKNVLELLDDSDSSISEDCLQLIIEMVKNQKDNMEDSIEVVIEKLVRHRKDAVCKIQDAAEECLSVIFSEYDPLKCLSAIETLLVTEDERTLIVCINSLTKVVNRISDEELLGQLPSFLPVLFDVFSNQSCAVRKAGVFCLVEMYMKLGKALLPYLEELGPAQLRLVTIYANRMAQARKVEAVEN